MKPQNTESTHIGLKRIFYAAGYSWLGLKATWREEAAFRQEVVLFLLLFPWAFMLGDTLVEWAVLIGVLVLVLIVEILNSAIESIVDRIGSEKHELSGRAKDQGSAAVLISLIFAGAVWAGFAITKYMELVGR